MEVRVRLEVALLVLLERVSAQVSKFSDERVLDLLLALSRDIKRGVDEVGREAVAEDGFDKDANGLEVGPVCNHVGVGRARQTYNVAPLLALSLSGNLLFLLEVFNESLRVVKFAWNPLALARLEREFGGILLKEGGVVKNELLVLGNDGRRAWHNHWHKSLVRRKEFLRLRLGNGNKERGQILRFLDEVFPTHDIVERADRQITSKGELARNFKKIEQDLRLLSVNCGEIGLGGRVA